MAASVLPAAERADDTRRDGVRKLSGVTDTFGASTHPEVACTMPESDTQQRARTFRQYRAEGEIPVGLYDELLTDEVLSLMSAVLVRRGDTQLAATLGRIARTELVGVDYWDDEQQHVLWLEYEPEDADDFEVCESKWNEVCQHVSGRAALPVCNLRVREVLPVVGYGWRDQLQGALSGGRPINQARKARVQGPVFTEDHLAFTNEGERTVYRALKRMQDNDFPSEDTIGIYPLAAGRIPGHTWEPDFLVTYQGRTGVLEVDGPHHNQRRALDTTREHLLRESGIATVDRVTVEAVENPNELERTLRRFVRNLQRHR